MKEYEVDYDKPFINMQALILIALALLVIGYMVYPAYAHSQVKPIEVKPVENISTAIQIEYVTVMVTPEIDGKTYYASEYEEGIRKIQNPFSFYRKNASGYKDLKISAEVYDYKITDSLHWFNPSDYKYYELLPEAGYKYLWVFYAIWSDDVIGKDARFYLPSTDTFTVENRKTAMSFMPVGYPKQYRIAELEHSRDFNNREQAEYFATERVYSPSTEYRNTAGEYATEYNWLRGGMSNAVSGYVLYQITDKDNPEDLMAGINFYSWGTSWWRLKP